MADKYLDKEKLVMAEFLEFSDILHQFRGAMYAGRLKLQTSCITYKSLRTGKLEKHQSADIVEAHWMRRSRGGCLKVTFNNDDSSKFDGFKESDFDLLSEYMKRAYKVDLKRKDSCVKGWNWGDFNFKGNILDFVVDNLSAMEIPLSDVSNATTAKNEVALEFHPNDDAPVQIVEMRLYVPTDASAEVDPVADFHSKVMARADIVQATGDAITTFTEVQCLTPRGRYNIKVYPAFLQLHGKTFDYKIPYTTVLRLFLLPHRDRRQYYFMISLDPPIKQGQTRYHYLVLVFNKEVDLQLKLFMTDEDLKEKYAGKLKREMDGPEHEIISRIMKVLVNKKITVPGSFQGHTKSHSIACSYKAATGYLYPLERGFVFVHKPPIHLRFDEIGCVNFARSAGSTRYFDFDIETTGGSIYNFVGIEKDEYGQLYDFVKQKGLRVKNVDKTDGKKFSYAEVSMEDSDEEDDDYDDDNERKKRGGGEDDDDEETDEDFKPEGSGSEPDDEYDSKHESSSEDGGADDDTKKKKKGKKKDGDDDADDDDDDAKKKKKKKDADDDDDDDDAKKKKKKKDSDDDDDDDDAKKKKKEKKKKKKDDDDDDDHGKKRKHTSDNNDDDDDSDDDDEKKEEEKTKRVKKVRKEKEVKSRDSKKRRKKDKDPNRPKRAQSAYFLWLGEIRSKLKLEFPGISITELSKKAGERWREVGDKTRWEKLAAKEKVIYEKAMEEYKRTGKATSNDTKESPKKDKKASHSKTEVSSDAFKSKEFVEDDDDDDAGGGGGDDDAAAGGDDDDAAAGGDDDDDDAASGGDDDE